MKITALLSSLIAVSLSLPLTAMAGTYGDTLTKCLVERTTPADKTLLVQWIFSTIAVHPDVSSMMSMNADRRVQAKQKGGRHVSDAVDQNLSR